MITREILREVVSEKKRLKRRDLGWIWGAKLKRKVITSCEFAFAQETDAMEAPSLKHLR